jgi:hypothetical protein
MSIPSRYRETEKILSCLAQISLRRTESTPTFDLSFGRLVFFQFGDTESNFATATSYSLTFLRRNTAKKLIFDSKWDWYEITVCVCSINSRLVYELTKKGR